MNIWYNLLYIIIGAFSSLLAQIIYIIHDNRRQYRSEKRQLWKEKSDHYNQILDELNCLIEEMKEQREIKNFTYYYSKIQLNCSENIRKEIVKVWNEIRSYDDPKACIKRLLGFHRKVQAEIEKKIRAADNEYVNTIEKKRFF